MYYLYWIHLENHTKPLSEGYVGLTGKPPDTRFDQHKKASISGTYIIHKAIRKYGDKLKLSVLFCGIREDVLEMEFQLRSKPYIAWNMNTGGGGNLGRKHSEYSKQLMSTRLKEVFKVRPQKGHPCSVETKQKLSETKVGKPVSENTKNGLKNFLKGLAPYERGNTNKSLWIDADKFYAHWAVYRLGAKKMAKEFNLSVSSLTSMVTQFKQNWSPALDQKWLAWKSKNKIGNI